MDFEIAKAKLLAKQPAAINILEALDDKCPAFGCGAKSMLFYQLPPEHKSDNWPRVTLVDLKATYWLRGGFFCSHCGWGVSGSIKISEAQAKAAEGIYLEAWRGNSPINEKKEK